MPTTCLSFPLALTRAAQVSNSSFQLFSAAVKSGGVVKVIAVPNGSRLSNSALKPKGDVYEQAVAAGGAGLVFARVSVAATGDVALDAPKAVKDCFTGLEQDLVRLAALLLTADLAHR